MKLRQPPFGKVPIPSEIPTDDMSLVLVRRQLLTAFFILQTVF